MRTPLFRLTATALGIAFIPIIVIQLRDVWPLSEWELCVLGAEAAVAFAFLSFGLGIGPLRRPPTAAPAAAPEQQQR